MSQEVLNSHQPRITCLPNPGDYRLLNFIGKKELLKNVILIIIIITVTKF